MRRTRSQFTARVCDNRDGAVKLIAPDVVYLENMTSDLYVENETEVYRYVLAFDRLRGLALGPSESVALITARADSIESP